MRRAPRIAGAALAFALLPLAPAVAELLRCEGPDGRTIFTDQAARCPDAEPFEPSGTVQKAPGAAPAPARERSPERDLAGDAEEARKAQWVAKKRAAEQELERARARRESLKAYVAHCNRGGDVTTRDEAGLKQGVSCEQLRRDFEAAAEREAELRSYLEEGLAEECRRAGCLPGWIR